MINKIYKRIHNKYYILFKFFFFLRYVFSIFIIAIILFLSIPKFFNYEKKNEIIRKLLNNHYDLELKNYSQIEYRIFPLPNLVIKKANFTIKNNPIKLESTSIQIFLYLNNIYNFKNIKAKKIIANESKISLEVNLVKNFVDFISKIKNKIYVNNLNLEIKRKDITLANVNNINFSNYGHDKYDVTGEIFENFFKLSLNDNQNLNFKILNTDVKANFKFHKKNFNLNSGSSKISLAKNIIKFNFNLNNNELEIFKSNFRNKYLSFSLDSFIKFIPYFSVNSKINIKEIDHQILNKFSLEKILKKRNIIKKLNNKISINYENKKYFTNLIESYSSDLTLAYGRVGFTNEILITGGEINCSGDSVLIDEYPRLNFNCIFNIKDRKKLIRKLSLPKNIIKENFNLNIDGSLNLIGKKINLKKIYVNNNYFENKEDIKYFEDKFEDILFSEGIFKIFNKNRIKKFILEII